MKWTAAESYSGGDYAGEVRKAFTPGNRNFEFWSSLDVQSSDLVVDKTRYSGFIPGTSALHDLLQARGIGYPEQHRGRSFCSLTIAIFLS